ncbi:acyl-[acyl-carrier-protein] thioesterase [Konateibacter massiliensis]|uniref:acyl-[acyl-carrier-protein] thioesterase n=1 Tax=Konateibacter massiliensis TaxID=2002841 RepID=UPI000C145C0A|nr:acyl-ACP thioesterase domain-containing protein [Konateibacter massiliensis]
MFSFQTKVRYSEIDMDGRTTVSSIVNYFQDCSTFQSEHIGQGISTLIERGKGWLLTSWQVDIKRQLELGEEIKVGTWAHDFKGLYGARNFVIYDEKGEIAASANTLWALVDLQTGHPTKITEEDSKGYDLEPPLDMVYLPRKIKLPEESERLESFRVRRSNLDTNHHVNNGQYIELAEEYLPQGAFVKQMRAEYKKAAVYQDIIVPKQSIADGKYIIELCDENDNTYAVVEFVIS